MYCYDNFAELARQADRSCASAIGASVVLITRQFDLEGLCEIRRAAGQDNTLRRQIDVCDRQSLCRGKCSHLLHVSWIGAVARREFFTTDTFAAGYQCIELRLLAADLTRAQR